MKGSIKLFNHHIIRTIEENDNILYNAKDICKSLNIGKSNVKKYLSRLKTKDIKIIKKSDIEVNYYYNLDKNGEKFLSKEATILLFKKGKNIDLTLFMNALFPNDKSNKFQLKEEI